MKKHYRVLNTYYFFHEVVCFAITPGWDNEMKCIMNSTQNKEDVNCGNCVQTKVFREANV